MLDNVLFDEGSDKESESVVSWVQDRIGPVEMVPVKCMRSGLSPREGGRENQEHVRVLSESCESLPPIIVHRPTMRVIDGMHRLRVAVLRKQETISVKFFGGSERDAFVLAVHANVSHGLPLSLAERKAAAARIVHDFPHWSDRLIAGTTGLSHKTVGALRKHAIGEDPQLHGSRTGRDGRVRKLDTEQGRKKAEEILRENPGKSLREVARIAGISTGTVRNVRRGLADGSGPNDDDTVRSAHVGASESGDYNGPFVSTQEPGYSVDVKNIGEHDSLQIGSMLLDRLRRDPSLKFAENGRAVLRLFSSPVVEVGPVINTIQKIPQHCYPGLAKLARANAQMWNTLALHLEYLTEMDLEKGSI